MMDNELICGCVVDGDNIPCVFDDPSYVVTDCNYATKLHDEGKGRDDCKYWKPSAVEEKAEEHIIVTLTAELTSAKEEIAAAKRESESLATAIWKRHYKEDSPNWSLCDSVAGVVSQIDNMVAGLNERLASERKETERLREALRFYAQGKHYILTGAGVAMLRDHGATARAALLLLQQEAPCPK